MHHRRSPWRGRLVLALLVGWAGVGQAAPVPGQGTWETTLQARDINHDGSVDAYYDTALNVTWLADAFADGPPPGFPAGRPLLFWGDAQEWVHSLDVHGVTGWRLPSVIDVPDATAPSYRYCPTDSFDGGSHGLCGYNSDPTQSELSHMFYVTLGNVAVLPVTDGSTQPDALENTGPFQDLRSRNYWSGTRNAASMHVWTFDMRTGAQWVSDPVAGLPFGAWAVRDGDVAAVPEPAPLVLSLVGGLTLWWMQRRRVACGGGQA